MTDSKRVRLAYLVTLGVITFQFLDVFFVHSSMPLFSTNIFARLIGTVALIVFSSVLGFSLKKFCFKTYGWFFEVLYGLLFSIIPILIVYLCKYIYFLYRGYENLTLTFRPSGFTESDGSQKYIVSVIVYVITILLVAVFKEIFYRGYLITQFSGKYGVPVSILIQGIIYTLSFVPTLTYYWVSGRFEFQGPLMSFFLICGHLFYNFISGIKWGMYYRVNGTVWMAVADHFMTNLIVSSFFFTESRLPEKWYIIEVIVIQLISICLFIPFFLRRDRQNELAAAEYALTREALKMGFDNYSPSVIRKKIDERSQHRSVADSHDSQIFYREEPVNLSDIRMPTEDDLTSSVRSFAINDSSFEYNTEVDAYNSSPSEKAKDYFNSALKVEEVIDADEPESDNAQNISRLVENYFTESFDKHTFK
ncbi:MAG: lysostaphin resistance A-like protein [Acutalibacteraceae bacterium]|nr:lysostaphin resistance A-like protein [Acutalibacteraceae bacterium]